MDTFEEMSKGTIQNQKVRMNDLVPNEDVNEEEGPIDFGVEPTTTLTTIRKPTAPRNLKKDKKCCYIL